MKGLDWFRVMTDIAWDGDLENVSDAEFRTFFELVAMSAYHLTDGVVSLSTARKHLNTRRVNDALKALSAHGLIILDADTITIPSYSKYQQTREEVAAERKRNRERVRRYRAVTPTDVTEQSKSKSDSDIKSTTYSREVASIFTYWQEVMGKPKAILTADRRAKIQARLRDGYTEEQIKQGIDGCRASAWHMGENPNGKQYNDFDLICRNGSKLEQFIAAKEGSKTALQILRERWNK